MQQASLLQNTIQHYPWGSKTAIPELLGEAPDGTPQAELWMGAHPKAPSRVWMDGAWVPLTDLLQRFPEEILGKAPFLHFGPNLPYLFKILAADTPLSIQAHPDAVRAREGFLRESAMGVHLDSPIRTYKDDRHKPECLCALTPFWALNGFRSIPEILANIRRICPDGLREETAALEMDPTSAGLKLFFQGLLTMPEEKKLSVLREVVECCWPYSPEDPVCRWILELQEAYPRDLGALSPAFLNLIHLEAGEALFISAGRLHAYLHGVGVELMANSDNVLRGGLTPKHMDAPELLSILEFTQTLPDVLCPVRESPGVRRYDTPAEEFSLSEITVAAGLPFEGEEGHSVEVWFCVRGEAELSEKPCGKRLTISKGTSFLIPAALGRYIVEGNALFYRASLPFPLKKGGDI